MSDIQKIVGQHLDIKLRELSSHCNSDVMAIYGPMIPGLAPIVREQVDDLSRQDNFNAKLTLMLDTGGGSINTVERVVDVIRHHYEKVDFIIPDQAMSAGTIFALSGDSIYMDYFSALGPIDPQFLINGKWVPVLGYLEQFKELNEKSIKGSITDLEFALVDKLDLADLHQYEQAREHSVELLKKWLSVYKFKCWKKTETRGIPVTATMRQERAKEIALRLNNTTRWHDHSRGIPMKALQDELKLLIENFENDKKLSDLVKSAHKFMIDYIDYMELANQGLVHCVAIPVAGGNDHESY